MGRKNNYQRFDITIRVKSMADAVNLMENMVNAGVLPEGVGLRERDTLDAKDALGLIVDNGSDPHPGRIWRDGVGIVNDERFSRDDLKALAGA